MQQRSLAALVLALATSVGAVSCGGGVEPPRLVVLYAACTVNKSYLSPYDDDVDFTPAFAKFASEGVTFERHVTEAGQSGISFASLFSGVHAPVHRAYRHPIRIPDDLWLITEAYADAGYDTWFYNGHRMGSIELNYGQGVPPDQAIQTAFMKVDEYTATDARFAGILERLQADPKAKAFVLINLTVSHSPYHAYARPEVIDEFFRLYPRRVGALKPEVYNRMIRIYDTHRLALQWDYEKTVAKLGLTEVDERDLHATLELAYRACMYFLDKKFGEFVDSIDAAGLRDDSLIAFTSDHGEVLYRDNALYQYTHGLQLAPEVLDVAWLLRGKGIRPGRYGSVTRSIDVYPTLAELSGISLPDGIEGVSLADAVRGRAKEPELVAFSHTTTLGPNLLALFQDWHEVIDRNPTEDARWSQVRVRSGDLVLKLRHEGGDRWIEQVFDLASDREERRDLYDPNDPRHAALASRAKAYRERLVDAFHSGEGAYLSSEAAREHLQGLGYVGGDEEEREPPAAGSQGAPSGPDGEKR